MADTYTIPVGDLQLGDRTTSAIYTAPAGATDAEKLYDGTGIILTGDLIKETPKEVGEGTEIVKFFEQYFEPLANSGQIVANLTNHDKLSGKVTIIVRARVDDPSNPGTNWFLYEFSHNIIKADK